MIRNPIQTGEHSWTVQVQEDGKTKELYLELPPEALAQVGWDIGDTLIWEELDHGAWSIRKKDDV
jgi:hypothetical protein